MELTQSQQLLLLGQSLNPEAPLYNMALAFRIHGPIEVDHFQLAFSKLIECCDALKLTFSEENGAYRQHFNATLPTALEYLDWTSTCDNYDEVQKRLALRSQIIFDLEQQNFDSVLIKQAENEYVWFLNQHHLITDGWSVTVLYKKMASLYEASLSGSLDAQKPLPAFKNYLDFELKSRNRFLDDSRSKRYWEQQLQSIPPTPKLYGEDNPKLSTDSKRVFLDLGIERSQQLRELTAIPVLKAWTQDLSLFNIFSTVLISFLYRISGQKRLVMGTPAHNRLSNDFKQTSGLFIELFPIVTELEERETFLSLFKKIQVETSGFLKHAQPGATSAEMSRGFNVVLNYINASFSDFADLPMTSDWIHPNHADASHALRLQVQDFDATGNIKLHFDLNEAVFTQQKWNEVSESFLKLLDAFIADQSAIIDALPLLEIDVQPQDESSVNELFLTQFRTQVRENPDHACLVVGDKQLTYKGVDQLSDRLAKKLYHNVDSAYPHVGVFLKRSPELVVAVIACFKAGLAYVPLESNLTDEKLNHIIADAEIKCLITDHLLIQKHPDLDQDIVLEINEALKSDLERNEPLDKTPLSSANLAYIMYTSGSTGTPKGVMITHGNLAHYLSHAQQDYQVNTSTKVPLFTAIGFDLTVTSLFLPLATGATTIIYPETHADHDLSVIEVVNDNQVDFIKLTPAHLQLVPIEKLENSSLKTMILGGENLDTDLASKVQKTIGTDLTIVNEYGPTEATVGCVTYKFDMNGVAGPSVPIGKTIQGMQTFVLDDYLNPVPEGVTGELYLSGYGLSTGYWNSKVLTDKSFIDHPFIQGTKIYKTGDLVRVNRSGDLVFQGRIDDQVKIGSRRVELREIESAIEKHEGIENCVVELRSKLVENKLKDNINCARCGLPSSYPNITYDDHDVCNYCNHYDHYKDRVQKYFKTLDDLKSAIATKQGEGNAKYDCISLLSGGKDSTYALAQLVDMGFNVLAFTLDNGYISDQAKDNVRRVCDDLGVDYIFGSTPVMNDVFVDSLKTHCNVCDGCFKTIYTLSTQIALEKNIPFIVTGLSRGQFFETRLTEELFRSDDLNDIAKIDQIILNARKAYHRVDDGVRKLLDSAMFDTDEVFEKVQFLDFYRYTDVSLGEMLDYLDKKLSWKRPTDTGRSTNCLINQAGIYVHKKERGYSNYAFPYSWDVRLGHKKRDESLEEINEAIDEQEVFRMLDEIGYSLAEDGVKDELIAYYTGTEVEDDLALRALLEGTLPSYMIPAMFVHIDKIPLSDNGKIDKGQLVIPDNIRPHSERDYVAPRTDIEEILVDIWSEVLNIDKVGVYDKFLEVGGSSLSAIRIISRANEAFELDLPINLAFNKPTIASFAEFVRATIMDLLEQMDEEDS